MKMKKKRKKEGQEDFNWWPTVAEDVYNKCGRGEICSHQTNGSQQQQCNFKHQPYTFRVSEFSSLSLCVCGRVVSLIKTSHFLCISKSPSPAVEVIEIDIETSQQMIKARRVLYEERRPYKLLVYSFFFCQVFSLTAALPYYSLYNTPLHTLKYFAKSMILNHLKNLENLKFSSKFRQRLLLKLMTRTVVTRQTHITNAHQ